VVPAFQICRRSPPPAWTMRTVTEVAVPSHPARTEIGSTASEYVKVAMSPVSGRPAVPPPTLLVCTSAAAGAVLSTVTEKPVAMPAFPAASVAVMLNVFAPGMSTRFAVCAVLR
jgi:hypothetical protein